RREPARQAPARGQPQHRRRRPCPARPEQPLSPEGPPVTEPGQPSAYAAAGVDIDAADTAVDLMRAWVEKTGRPEVIGSLGGFAGLYDGSPPPPFPPPRPAHSPAR